jgi:hypothetical protein
MADLVKRLRASQQLIRQAADEIECLHEERASSDFEPPLGKMTRLTIDVPPSLHRRIKMKCAERGTIMADEIRSMLVEKFK